MSDYRSIRLAVVGGRNFHDAGLLARVLGRVNSPISEIVSGGAKGADSLAGEYALAHGIPLKVYLPDWNKFGRKAGFLRNKDIIARADAVIAFWDGKSRGTKNSIELAEQAGIPVYIRRFR